MAGRLFGMVFEGLFTYVSLVAYGLVTGDPIPMAALLAILSRANLPISVLLVWISNPLTWVVIYTPPYLLGLAILWRWVDGKESHA